MMTKIAVMATVAATENMKDMNIHHHKHLDGVTKKKYRIEGIDCPNCAAKVERKMNELPDVAVTLTFATSQLLVEAKNPDEVISKT